MTIGVNERQEADIQSKVEEYWYLLDTFCLWLCDMLRSYDS